MMLQEVALKWVGEERREISRDEAYAVLDPYNEEQQDAPDYRYIYPDELKMQVWSILDAERFVR